MATRLTPITCNECREDHYFSNGALILVIQGLQDGDLITTKLNTMCLMLALENAPTRIDGRIVEGRRDY